MYAKRRININTPIKDLSTDHRQGQRVVMTLEIEDRGQDFIELDVLENGVLLGDSMIFANGRQTLVGIGSGDGMTYYTREAVLTKSKLLKLKGLLIYMKDTGERDPLPWQGFTLKYPVVKMKNAKDADRFIKSK